MENKKSPNLHRIITGSIFIAAAVLFFFFIPEIKKILPVKTADGNIHTMIGLFGIAGLLHLIPVVLIGLGVTGIFGFKKKSGQNPEED